MSSPFNRSLFAQMPPSIVITEPVPRWKALAQYTLKIGSLLLLGAAGFYAGMLYERRTPVAVAPQAPVESADVTQAQPLSAPVAAALPSSGPAPVAVPEDLLAPLSIEGLQIQSLRVVREAPASGQLRYAFEILNEGRVYEGSFEFVVLGVQEGRTLQWVFPTESLRGSGAYRLRVARYLKMDGKFELPVGLAPQAVALRLRESAGVRASRGQLLSENGPTSPGAPAPARPQ